MLAVGGRPAKLMLISELAGAKVAVAELLPPLLVPPLESLVAPVVTTTALDAAVVGVPVTGHEMLEPGATVAGGAGEQAPSTRPAGRPDTAHDALVAEAVAEPLLVHLMAPL
jgi:hypothetical protein